MAWFQKKPANAGQLRAQPAGQPIHELLNEGAVLFPPAAADKPRVLELLVAAACSAHRLGDPAPLLARVRERETGISTTLDTGLSLPHARVEGLDRVAAALAVLPHGLADPQHPEIKIRAMFLFFSPNKQAAFTTHLQVLRGVSTLFQPVVVDALIGLKTPAEVLALMRSRQC